MAFVSDISYYIPILTLFLVAIWLLYRFVCFLWAPKPGPNPFARDCSKPAQPLVLNHSARDKVLKQGFAVKKIPANLDAIVIGSGIGGLTAAAILAKVGKSVLVLEQHDKPGGCCHAFIEKGFEFDLGIHYVGEMQEGALPRTLIDQLTEGQLQWERLDDEYEMFVIGEPGRQKMYPLRSGSYDTWRLSLIDIFPDEEDVITKYINLMKAAGETIVDQMLFKFLPKSVCHLLFKTGIVNRMTDFFKYSNTSPQEVLDGLTDNKALKTLLTYNFGTYGCLPRDGSFAVHAAEMQHFVGGAWYPRGGSSEIAFHMIPVIQKGGGRVLVRAPVTEILAENGRVVGVKVKKGEHGDEVDIRAPLVISNSGVTNTLSKLLPKELATQSGIPKMIGKQVNPGGSFLSVFVGLKGTTEELGLTDKNYWVLTTNDINRDVGAFLASDMEEVEDREVPFLYITFSSAKDSTFNTRYPGKSVCKLITVASYEWFAAWENETARKRGTEYEALKNRLGERMWHQTCFLFPHLADKVEYFEVGTPVTNRYYLNYSKGEMYGLDQTKARYGCPEVIMNLRPETDIPGLLLTGQDVTGSGFWPGMLAGMVCASKVLQRNITDDLQGLKTRLEKQK